MLSGNRRKRLFQKYYLVLFNKSDLNNVKSLEKAIFFLSMRHRNVFKSLEITFHATVADNGGAVILYIALRHRCLMHDLCFLAKESFL